MTNLLRVMAVCATLFAVSTPAIAGGPSTTIVNNGNNNINIVVNIQAPTINVGMPGFPGFGGLPMLPPPPLPGMYPGMMPPPPGFLPPPPGAINQVFNYGDGNFNRISNQGQAGAGAQNTIVNFGNYNVNRIRNRDW